MRRLNIKKILLIIIVTLNSYVASASDQQVPPILDFLPNCDYEIIDTIKSKVITINPKDPSVIEKILQRITNKAIDVSAEAIILTGKQNKYAGFSKNKYSISIDAELIKLCEEDYSAERVRTKITSRGERVLNVTTTQIGGTRTYDIKLPEKALVKRPKINNKNVSLNGGAYGVNIGDSMKDVITKFGDPSATLAIRVDEVVLAYGRKHWFHFQLDRLVKIETDSSYASQELINQIPFYEFFDDFTWKIDNKIGYQASLEQVKTELATSKPLNAGNQLILSNKYSTISLNFTYYKDQISYEKNYSLNGFSITDNSYKPNSMRKEGVQSNSAAIVNDVYKKLLAKESIDFEKLQPQMHTPLVTIYLPSDTLLKIYDNHVIFRTKQADLVNIQFKDQLFIENILEDTLTEPWFLSEFEQGKTYSKLAKLLPNNIVEFNDEVNIHKDNYHLQLFFYESKLYEAELKLH